MLAIFGICLLFTFMFAGLPVAMTLILSGAIGLFAVGGTRLLVGILTSTPLASIQGFEFLSVPMFILMANFIIVSRVSDDLFSVAKIWMGRIPGGLAHATALTGALFGAISGSSTAAAATLSTTSIPGMLKQGYSMKLATGVAAISGTLAILIPPSVAMVIYALLAQMSVGKMLIAGILPGILVTLTIMVTVMILVWRNPDHAPPARGYSFREKVVSLRSSWTFIFLFMLVTGIIYTGIATPTEASAFGAFGSFLLAVWRGARFKQITRALVTTVEASCMIAFIVLGAMIFGYFLTLTNATQNLISYVMASGLPGWVVIVLLLFMYLVMGCFMDMIAMLILTIPLVQPLIVQLGYDPIWFAVITIVMGEVGLVTPPYGMNVFVIAKYTKIPVEQVFRGSVPHVIAHLVAIAILVVFPQIILWLPSYMK